MPFTQHEPATDGPVPPVDPRLLTLVRRLVPAAALVAMVAGVVALTGWSTGLDALHRVVPGASSMKPNTAVCLILLGFGLWATVSPTRARRRAALIAGLVVVAVGVTTLVEYLTGTDLIVDRVLFRAATVADTVGSGHPGRPAPNTATALVLLGGAHLLLHARGGGERTVRAAQVMSLSAAVVGLLSLYGYAFRVPVTDDFLGLTGMAVHTASVLTLIAVATLFARPRTGLARVLIADGPSAMLTRRMIIATAVAPPLLGAVCLYGRDIGHWYDTRLAVALLVVGNVIVFTVVSFGAGARAARLEAARDHSEVLLARHAQLQAVVDHMSASVFMKDLSGRYVLVNEAFEKMLGDGHVSALGHSDAELFDPGTAADLDRYATQARTTTQTVRFEQDVTLGPTAVTYLSEVFALHDPAGQPYATCGILTDISDRKLAELRTAATTAKLQEELVLRERIEAELRDREAELTAFAYEVAHDLRGPLTPIAGFARILAEDLDAGVRDPALLVPNLERICAGVDRMDNLIGDLLAYATARDGAIHPEPVDLQAMVAAIVAERTGHLREGDDLEPDISTGPLPAVRADPVLCRQLLDNLIGNAIKYTRPDHAAHVAITARSEADGWVRVDVADRGIGISAGDQEQVFASFHRAPTDQVYAGTGLGLAICRRVVARHHGSIQVGDNPGGGSRFTFHPAGAAPRCPRRRTNRVTPVAARTAQVMPPVCRRTRRPLPVDDGGRRAAEVSGDDDDRLAG